MRSQNHSQTPRSLLLFWKFGKTRPTNHYIHPGLESIASEGILLFSFIGKASPVPLLVTLPLSQWTISPPPWPVRLRPTRHSHIYSPLYLRIIPPNYPSFLLTVLDKELSIHHTYALICTASPHLSEPLLFNQLLFYLAFSRLFFTPDFFP